MTWTDRLIERPVLAAVLNILIFLVGLRSFFELPTRQYPEITDTLITVTTVYPGASADLMQGFVTTPLQQSIMTAAGVDYVTSTSNKNISTIKVKVQLNFSPDVALSEVMAKVAEVKSELPNEVEDPKIVKSTGDTLATVYMAFNSDRLSREMITDYLSRDIQPKLSTIEGVSEAQILGGQTFAMRIWLDPQRMAAHNLSAQQVREALLANNYLAAPGKVKGAYVAYNVQAETNLQDVAAFQKLVVSRSDTALVRLEDIADVALGAESYDSMVNFMGEPAVFIGLKNGPDANPLDVVDRLMKALPDIQKDLPQDLMMKVVYDSSKFIRAAIYEVVSTLVEATLIVFVVVLLFLGSFRAVLIPVITIPLSLVGVCTILSILGFSINLLTLLAMVLAIGLVVDDAIVVMENIYRHLQKGLSPIQAAKKGTREITGPIISMTLTLVAVYTPIAFMSGVTGSLFREFALTLAGSVVISGIIALTLSPVMCSKILARPGSEGAFAHAVEGTLERLTQWYQRVLTKALDYRFPLILFSFGLMGSIAFFLKVVPQELAPLEDKGYMMAITKGPQQANLDYMKHYAAQVDTAFRSFNETELSFVISGLESGPSSGFGFAIFKPWNERRLPAMALASMAQKKLADISGIQGFAFVPPPLPGAGDGLPIQFVIKGLADYRTLYELMEKIKAEARKSGLFMVVDSDLDFNNLTHQVHVDAQKSNLMGVQMRDIATTLSLFMGGNLVNRFSLQGRSYDVIPQVPRSFRLESQDMGNFYVRSASGMVPLSTLVSIRQSIEPNSLTQFNQVNAATFQAIQLPWITVGKCVAFLKNTAATMLPKGISYDFVGEARQYVKEGNALIVTFVFALIVIFLVLAAQFESWRDPLIVMLTVPLSLFGALYFLFQGFATLNIYTQVGLVTLVGLITKHGILMTEFANTIRDQEKCSRHEAIIKASSIRLRPILMTTASMVVGLFPLLVASGAGAISRFHMGLVIVTGMLIGTLFTLFVIPAYYTYMAHDMAAAPATHSS